MSTQVFIPFGGDDPHRLRNLLYVTEHYSQVFPTVVCPLEGEWSKGWAVHQPVADSDAEVVIIADADSVVTVKDLRWSVAQAIKHGWAYPHTVVRRLNADASERVLAGGRLGGELVQPERFAAAGGGVVVLRRDVWELAGGGFDPRFVGWGGEDAALGLVLGRLVHPFQPSGVRPLWHLWHPPEPRQARLESRRLMRSYRKAARGGTLETMAGEVRDAYTRGRL